MTTANRRRPARRLVLLVLALALVALGLSACLPPPSGTPATLSTNPPLYPSFRTDVRNYVVRCDPATPVGVHVVSPTDTYVSVNRGYPQSGIFDVNVSQSPGQRFTVDVADPGGGPAKTYNIRCLPSDFPQWSAEPAPYGLTAYFMTAALGPSPTPYTAIFDRWGVPIWWSDPQATIFSTLLPDGNVASLVNGGLEERQLDGTLVRTVNTVGGNADQHDVLLLPNGHYVLVTIQAKDGVDLSALGGPASASICDHVVQEIDPADNSVVWSWDTSDHIPVTEMDPQWEAGVIDGGPTILGCGYDVYHWNAIERTATGFLLSFRHLDAIYAVEHATGDIAWKLGGTSRAESLTVVGDPVFAGGSHFGGQHDVRLQADGTVSLYDDGTGLGRLARVVRYAIDTGAGTATLVESVTDPSVPTIFCCGSARMMGSGVWVIGFGGANDTVGRGGEYIGSTRQFTLTFPGALTYRVIPLTSSQVTTANLITAMDTKFANASASGTAEPQGSMQFPP